MTDKQRSWLCDKCDALLIAADDYLLTDEDADLLVAMSNDTALKANGNPIVKKAMLLTMDYIDKMNRIMRE